MRGAATVATRRSIVARILAATGISLAVFVGVLAVARHGLAIAARDSRAAQAAQALADDARASQAGAEVQRARVAEYLIDSDPRDVAEYFAMEQLERARLVRLRAGFAGDRGVQRALDRELDIAVRRRALVNEIFRMAPDGHYAKAQPLALQSESLTQGSLAQSAIVLAAARRRSDARVRAAHVHLRSVRALLAALGAGALALGLLAALFLVSTVGRSFDRVRGSEEAFRSLVSNIPGAAYRRAPSGDWSMRFVSARIREITGHSAAGLMADAPPYSRLVPDADRERVEQRLSELPGDETFTIDYAIANAGGETRWVREMGHAVRDPDGAVLWLEGTISDITPLRRLEEERERMEAELRLTQRLDAVGQLAAGIAHEINTPIQFVGDSVQFAEEAYGDIARLLAEYRALLDERGEDPRVAQAEEAADLDYLRERLPAALARTQDGVRRVATIVRAMKDFGQPSQVEHAPADLNAALRSTLVVSSSEYKHVADVETAFDELPRVICNVGELNQVFLNLIVNAAHAIGDAAHDGRRGTIRVSTECALDHAIVTIADDGPGIPPEIGDRVFEPFFTTKEVGRGTGQGLAIARSIVVDKHHGALSLDSRPGEGATFTVKLPVVRAHE